MPITQKDARSLDGLTMRFEEQKFPADFPGNRLASAEAELRIAFGFWVRNDDPSSDAVMARLSGLLRELADVARATKATKRAGG